MAVGLVGGAGGRLCIEDIAASPSVPADDPSGQMWSPIMRTYNTVHAHNFYTIRVIMTDSHASAVYSVRICRYIHIGIQLLPCRGNKKINTTNRILHLLPLRNCHVLVPWKTYVYIYIYI